jgi:integrase
MRAKAKNQPIKVVTHKNQVIPIYYTPDEKKGKIYESFTYSFMQHGKRVRRRARTLKEAEDAAKKAAVQLADGTGQLRTLRPSEIADFITAEKILHRHPGFTLAGIVSEWETATAALAGLGGIADAVAAFVKASKKATLPECSVAKMVEKFIEAKRRANLSDFYLDDIERKLDRFALAFRVNISTVAPEEIILWLAKQGSGRNANNLRSSVATLFSFARENGFLPRDSKHAAELVKKAKEKPSKIGIYTPEEITKIISRSSERFIPALAIAAFAGLRSTEIFRLDWQEIKLDRKIIVVEADKAKTASRRIVPILPNLAAWLEVQKKEKGRVAPDYHNLDNMTRGFTAICHAAGVTPQRNGFRHSFASYRLATEKSADAVALEMGNSPRKLFTNYRELVTEEEGKAWFSITPNGSHEKVVSFAA